MTNALGSRRGLTVLVDLNLDWILFAGTIIAALMVGAYIGSI